MGFHLTSMSLSSLLKAVFVGFAVVAIGIPVIYASTMTILAVASGVCFVDTAIIDSLVGTQTQSYCERLLPI